MAAVVAGGRFIVNDTPQLWPPELLEYLMQAWERSPYPPKRRKHILTRKGYEHARQQLLKERLRARRQEKAAQSHLEHKWREWLCL